MVLEIISIVVSVFALSTSICIWYSDKKSVWYWNVVVVPLQDIFKDLKGIDIDNKENIITLLNRYCRKTKFCSDFLEIGIGKKKLKKLQDYMEKQFNLIAFTTITNDDGGNYLEIISNFEVTLYKKIAKLVLKK